MRQGRFPPFGFVLSEFGLQEPGLALFLAFFDFQNLCFYVCFLCGGCPGMDGGGLVSADCGLLRIADCCGLRIVTDCGLLRIACFYGLPDYGLVIGAREFVSHQGIKAEPA